MGLNQHCKYMCSSPIAIYYRVDVFLHHSAGISHEHWTRKFDSNKNNNDYDMTSDCEPCDEYEFEHDLGLSGHLLGNCGYLGVMKER